MLPFLDTFTATTVPRLAAASVARTGGYATTLDLPRTERWFFMAVLMIVVAGVLGGAFKAWHPNARSRRHRSAAVASGTTFDASRPVAPNKARLATRHHKRIRPAKRRRRPAFGTDLATEIGRSRVKVAKRRRGAGPLRAGFRHARSDAEVSYYVESKGLNKRHAGSPCRIPILARQFVNTGLAVHPPFLAERL